MRKISDTYSAVSAREELRKRFDSSSAALTRIEKLSDTCACALLVMMEGYTITTTGYSVPADYGVNRASAVIHTLEQAFFPVSNRRIETESDVGKKAYQSVFFITAEDREKMELNPEEVFLQCRHILSQKKWHREVQDMRRLLKELGPEGVRELLEQVANDSSGPEESAS
ncbi:hypothetical protein [Erwinia sp.]|uniref:hypothetical protein n=1 Tax=Erwinia citreus TaxID=558 RepID=UPI0028988DF4|nr:hypothetical protein [Erwinia sp.]